MLRPCPGWVSWWCGCWTRPHWPPGTAACWGWRPRKTRGRRAPGGCATPGPGRASCWPARRPARRPTRPAETAATGRCEAGRGRAVHSLCPLQVGVCVRDVRLARDRIMAASATTAVSEPKQFLEVRLLTSLNLTWLTSRCHSRLASCATSPTRQASPSSCCSTRTSATLSSSGRRPRARSWRWGSPRSSARLPRAPPTSRWH